MLLLVGNGELTILKNGYHVGLNSLVKLAPSVFRVLGLDNKNGGNLMDCFKDGMNMLRFESDTAKAMIKIMEYLQREKNNQNRTLQPDDKRVIDELRSFQKQLMEHLEDIEAYPNPKEAEPMVASS